MTRWGTGLESWYKSTQQLTQAYDMWKNLFFETGMALTGLGFGAVDQILCHIFRQPIVVAVKH